MSCCKGLQIREIGAIAHENAVKKGFYDQVKERNVGEVIALMHSELSEALEEWRTGRPLTEIRYDGEDPRERNHKPEGFPIELADCVIRICETANALGIDLEEAIILKMNYNKTRPYRHGGKVA